jgi:hypothetical protein
MAISTSSTQCIRPYGGIIIKIIFTRDPVGWIFNPNQIIHHNLPGEIIIVFPFDGVGEDVVVDALVVGFVADDMVVEAALEDGGDKGLLLLSDWLVGKRNIYNVLRDHEPLFLSAARHEPHENGWILLGGIYRTNASSRLAGWGSGSIYPWGAHVDLSQRIY